MIIHNPILTGSFTVNGTDVSSITSSAASLTSLNAYTASQNNRNGTYATTGSNTFAGIQTVNSNLVVTGSITAQTLVVQTITSSVDFVTGSTRFGSVIENTHVFTGSVGISGSLTSNGALSGTSATFSTQLKVANTTGSALDMLVLETGFNNPSGNKSIIWKDATSPLGRISVSYDASTGSTMRFGSLYNGGYQTSDLLTIASTGAATFVSSVATTEIFANSSSPKITFSPASYSGAYRTVLGTRSGAEGVLQLGNNNPNFIVGGNTGVGGSLHFYVNATSDFITSTNGTLALVLGSSGAATFYSSVTARLGLTIYGSAGTYTTGDNPFIGLGTTSADTFGAINMPFGDRMRLNSYHGFEFKTSNSTAGLLTMVTISISGETTFAVLGTGPVYSNSGRITNTNPSDIRLKENIQDITYGLDEIIQLRPVTYNWKDDKINQGKQFGFIAQEVQEIMPDLVKDGEYLGLDKEAIFTILVKAIQELKAEIEILKNK
jgi:hypothetical protein